MKTTINMGEALHARVVEFRDSRQVSTTTAVNILVEKGLESLERDGAAAEANGDIMARLDEIQRALERASEAADAASGAARSIGRAEAAAGRAAASAKLAAQSSYASLLASTVGTINLASIGNEDRLVYHRFRDRDLASVARFFMEAGRAASEDERARAKVWPAFKGAAAASGDEAFDPAAVFFEGRRKHAAAAMDPASGFCDGPYRVKAGKEGGVE